MRGSEVWTQNSRRSSLPSGDLGATRRQRAFTPRRPLAVHCSVPALPTPWTWTRGSRLCEDTRVF